MAELTAEAVKKAQVGRMRAAGLLLLGLLVCLVLLLLAAV